MCNVCNLCNPCNACNVCNVSHVCNVCNLCNVCNVYKPLALLSKVNQSKAKLKKDLRGETYPNWGRGRLIILANVSK